MREGAAHNVRKHAIMRPRVLVTRRIPEAGLALLREAVEVELHDSSAAIPRDVLLAAVRGKDGILALLTDRMDAEVFDAAPGLKVVANMAVGYDNVDLEEAARRGVRVTNTPDVLTDATADLAFALLLAVSRRLMEGHDMMRASAFPGWDPLMLLGHAVAGRTLGIVGMGRIGRAVAERATGFRMDVLYLRRGTPPQGLGSERWHPVDTLDELLAFSDFVTLHAPLTPQTRHLIGAARLARMKPTAYLVNTSRGPLVDEAALAAALRDHVIAGAALDVFEREPEVHPDLLTCGNCLMMPHIGSATVEARDAMATTAALNLLAVLRGEIPPNPVSRKPSG